MQDTVQTATTAGHREPGTVHAEPRTITYPVKTGGSLTTTCPSWCTADHTDDVAAGIHPCDLLHQGDSTRLEYMAEGYPSAILAANIAQYPYSGDADDSVPYIELTPEAGHGVSLYLHNRLEVNEQIERVRQYLRDLVALGEQLAEAQAADHALNTARIAKDQVWASFGNTDLMSLPVAYLLKALGVSVVETEDTGRKAVVTLDGEPGALVLRVKPDVPQHLREDLTRRALLNWYNQHRKALGNTQKAGA